MNPYRGCQHACVYCFARGTHAHLGYGGREFEQRVIVKLNLAGVLRQELTRPAWTRELVAVGTTCDPYQQAEMKYGLTRGALRAFIASATPIAIITKSPNILRDIDLLAELANVTQVQVNFSISTPDESLWRQLEPDTTKPLKRLEAMRHLNERGVRAGVLLAPILPGLTDDPANLESVIRAASEHGAAFLGDNVLHLKPGTKEWFMPFLREAYPCLEERYAHFYRGAYAPRTYSQDVRATVHDLKQRWGLASRERAPLPTHGQLRLSL